MTGASPFLLAGNLLTVYEIATVVAHDRAPGADYQYTSAGARSALMRMRMQCMHVIRISIFGAL